MEKQDLMLLGLDDEDDLLGARRIVSGRTLALRKKRAVQRVKAALKGSHSGVTGIIPGSVSLGFTAVQFINAGALTLQSIATPQKPMKGGRLVIDAAGTAAAPQPVRITGFLVGATNILPSADGLGIGQYRPDAVSTSLVLPPFGPGILLVITYTIGGAALAVGETIDMTTDLVGVTLLGISHVMHLIWGH